jgi:hypothetical protein
MSRSISTYDSSLSCNERAYFSHVSLYRPLVRVLALPSS